MFWFWLNLLVLFAGLKIITTLLGGGAGTDGIDKVDNGNVSPMQVCDLSISFFLYNKKQNV